LFRPDNHKPPRLDPVLVVGPSGSVISLDEVKEHLRADDSTHENDLITSLVSAVVQNLDGWNGALRRALLTQTWAESFRYLSGTRVPLRLAPVIGITSITYYDSDGNQQTLSSSAYRLQKAGGEAYVELDSDASWPSVDARDDAITITYSCGYGLAAAVPAPIKQAILLMVGDLYANREGVVLQSLRANRAVEALLAPYRRRASNL
jgi:uncharacterized phiE125 gp8 family phage protein